MSVLAAAVRSKPWLSRRTIRFRLTVLYGVLFLVTGAGLLAITYLLVRRSTTTALFRAGKHGTAIAVRGGAAALTRTVPRLRHGSLSSRQLRLAHQLGSQVAGQHARDLHQLLIQSGVALGIMAVLATVLGWLMAGRVLRPLRVMAASAQQITERNLHERLALAGPGDEVKDLADTIDGLLARLEAAFQAQRHFVANASHELRTPLTYDRALLEVALADPDASAGELRSACEELLASGEQQERLLEALLTLASSERGLERYDHFDLADVTRRAIAMHDGAAGCHGLRMNVSLAPAEVTGNADLAERLAANLVDNAIRYNVPDGRLDLRTLTRGNAAVLMVANTGPLVPEDQIGRLIQPFQRLADGRAAHGGGHGLGLYIVHAIATMHDAVLTVGQRPGGGLRVEVSFPAAV